MVVQLDTAFGHLSHGDFVIKVESLKEVWASHPGLAPWPPFVPGPDDYEEPLERLRTALTSAASGEPHKEAEFKVIRGEIQGKLILTGQYIVMKAIHANDPSVIATSALEIRSRTYARTVKEVTQAPTHFTVKRGKSSGEIIASAAFMEPAAGFELQVCDGNPEREDSWRLLKASGSCSRMKGKGLKEATKCYFRLRAHGDNSPGPWSEIVGLVIT